MKYLFTIIISDNKNYSKDPKENSIKFQKILKYIIVMVMIIGIILFLYNLYHSISSEERLKLTYKPQKISKKMIITLSEIVTSVIQYEKKLSSTKNIIKQSVKNSLKKDKQQFVQLMFNLMETYDLTIINRLKEKKCSKSNYDNSCEKYLLHLEKRYYLLKKFYQHLIFFPVCEFESKKFIWPDPFNDWMFDEYEQTHLSMFFAYYIIWRIDLENGSLLFLNKEINKLNKLCLDYKLSCN